MGPSTKQDKQRGEPSTQATAAAVYQFVRKTRATVAVGGAVFATVFSPLAREGDSLSLPNRNTLGGHYGAA